MADYPPGSDPRTLRVATCLSCGAPYGQPHGPNCEFS
jgi:hypothetical protein